jgi:hypothetical protein
MRVARFIPTGAPPEVGDAVVVNQTNLPIGSDWGVVPVAISHLTANVNAEAMPDVATGFNSQLPTFNGGVLLYTWKGTVYAYTGPPAANINFAGPGNFVPLGGLPVYATAADILAGQGATLIVPPTQLALASLSAPSQGTPAVADANHFVKLTATGQISPAFIPIQAMKFHSALDLSQPMPAGISVSGEFVAHVGATNAQIHPTWIGLTGRTNPGDIAIFDGASWHLVPTVVDLSSYLSLAGGMMQADATINWDAGTTRGNVIVSGSGGALDNVIVDNGRF